MRFIVACIGALLVTALVFLFMQSLIAARQSGDAPALVYEPVDVYQSPPEPDTEPPEPEQQEHEPEPAMEAISLSAPVAQLDVKLEMPALDIDMGDIDVAAVGDQWSAPLGPGGTGQLEAQGKGAQGFVEVVPFTTRKPNVPELAWTNKISGWVLVAFNVMPNGETRNIRVLDANPRGVFEEKVVAAVKDWKYEIRFTGEVQGDVVMTQKVEIKWQDFTMNLPNVD